MNSKSRQKSVPAFSFRTAPGTSERSREALTLLLQSCFVLTDDGSLSRFLSFLPNGNTIEASLPGRGSSKLQVINAAVGILVQRGAVDESFWHALIKERPGQKQLISALRPEIKSILPPKPIGHRSRWKKRLLLGFLTVGCLGAMLAYSIPTLTKVDTGQTTSGHRYSEELEASAPNLGKPEVKPVSTGSSFTENPTESTTASPLGENTTGDTRGFIGSGELPGKTTDAPAIDDKHRKPSGSSKSPVNRVLSNKAAISLVKKRCQRLAPDGDVSLYFRYSVSNSGQIRSFSTATASQSSKWGQATDITRGHPKLVECAKGILRRVVVSGDDTSRDLQIRL